MPDQTQRFGVQALWDAQQFVRGARDYNRAIDEANRQGEKFAQVQQRASREGANSFQRFSRTAQQELNRAKQANQQYIRSMIDLQAAFQTGAQLANQFGGALKEGAAGRDIRRAFASLAKDAGVSANELLSNMQRAARGTVAELDLIRIANRALLAGGAEFAESIPRLFEIARAASLATGQSIDYVFDTLTRGIAKASPLLIDNAEIYIKVGQSIDAYAESIGKSTEELTAQQRQTAVLNAVLDEGARFIDRVGSNADFASDKYNKFAATIENTKTAFTGFLDRLGPVGPLLSTAADLFIKLSPLLQTYILLKSQAARASIEHTTALAVETAALEAQAIAGKEAAAAILARGGALRGGGAAAAGGSLLGRIGGFLTSPVAVGVGAGVLGYEKIIRRLNPQLESTGAILDHSADILQRWGRELVEGKDKADDWFRSVNGMETSTDRLTRVTNEHRQELADLLKEIGKGPDAYAAYTDKVKELNTQLTEGEQATKLMSQAQFDLFQIFVGGQGSVDLQIAKLRELSGVVEQLPGAFKFFFKPIVEGFGEKLEARKIEETAQAEEDLAEQRKENAGEIEKILDEMSKLLAQNRDKQFGFNLDIERDERQHVSKMAELARKEASDREKAYRTFEKAVMDAERDRQRALEDAARNHAQRLADIELNYQRRIQDIENQFARTTRDAAIRRDALTIIHAREARAQQIQDAQQDRRDAIDQENSDYQETIRQTEQAYRDQLRAAKEALEERLADLRANLAEQRRIEQADWDARLTELRNRNNLEIAENRAKYTQLEADLNAHLSRVNAIIANYGVLVPSRTGRPGTHTPMQHGFAGMVEGPHTFTVEPGVREFVYASGDLNRQPITPSGGALAAQSLHAAVSGGVAVGLQGMNSDLMDRIGPQLRDIVGQGVVDAFTAALFRSLGKS